MRERDLLKVALENKKTVSRRAQNREGGSRTNNRVASLVESGPENATKGGSKKAQTRHEPHPTSPAPSPAASRGPSRAASRAGSVESDEESTWSTASLDDILAANDNNTSPETDIFEIETIVPEIIDRKRSSAQGREEALAVYIKILKNHFIDYEILPSRLSELVVSFSRSIKNHEASDKEAALALKALAVTAITVEGNSLYEEMGALLRRTASDSSSFHVKAAAIYCLGICAFFGGSDEAGFAHEMSFMMEIIESDGSFVSASDNAETVTAALETYALLATGINDMEEDSDEAIDVLADQLSSTEPNVLIAAGEAIALLYEKSYSPLEEGETEGETEGPDDEREAQNGPRLVKRYNAYHDTSALISRADTLAHLSGRNVSRNKKRDIHSNFASILTTLENPRHGPEYSKAINQETEKYYGARKTLKVHGSMEILLDRWWKWHRLAGLRRILQGGLVAHLGEQNPAVLDFMEE